MMRRRIGKSGAWGHLAVMTVALCAVACTLACASSAHASFGVVPGGFTTQALNRDGTVDTQAGSHPFAYEVSFRMNTDEEGLPEGQLRNVVANLPAGLVGNPTALPQCTGERFEGTSAYCPGDTQVGTFKAVLAGLGEVEGPVYNLVPPPGVPARIGFSAAEFSGLEDASVRTGTGYGVTVRTDDVPNPGKGVVSVEETIWGVPAERGHDTERVCIEVNEKGEKALVHNCQSEIPPRPFLTLPGSCTGPSTATLEGSGLLGETFVAESASGSAGAGAGLSGCEMVPFSAQFEATPTSADAESPSGLDVRLRIPQPEAPEGLAEADLKEAVVSLPAGMTVSPSAASGLQACPLTGSDGVNLRSSEAAACPAASRVGSVEVRTPLLAEPLHGSVFVGEQGDLPGNGENPFGSLLAIYIVAEGDGVVAKIPGEVRVEPGGQLVARFGRDPVTGEEFLPQLPYSELAMSFFGGARAPLMTPAVCGSYSTLAELTPWNGMDALSSSSGFSVLSGPGGGPCPAGAFTPSFTAVPGDDQAGAHSPLSVTFSRADGEQRFGAVAVTEPAGLLATLKGVAQCPEPQASEESLQACPAGSLIGETTVAAGPGGDPYWVKGGAVYLTGPYEGAPFGLKIVVPAVAGPFNLGREGKPVVVRARIEIDPYTSQATITSDPLPSELQNIPLDIRTVNVTTREGFAFNPTNCTRSATTATIFSTGDARANVSSSFQAADCAALPFKPSLTVTTQGVTSKADGASLTVDVREQPGEANIHKVDLQLPLALPARLTTLQKACTEGQFASDPAGCPEGSVIGTATAITPVLNSPLTGPAYLVSHGNAAFPDVEFVLQGENNVKIILDGKTDIKKGITYSKFETIPDAPVTSFQTVLPEGPHSALAANMNLCDPTKTVTESKHVTIRSHGRTKHVTRTVTRSVAAPLTAPTTLIGQNEATRSQTTTIAVEDCPTRTAKKAKAAKRAHVAKRVTPKGGHTSSRKRK